KRTFLGLIDATELPEDFRRAVKGIKMNGPCAKMNLVLAEEPRVHGMPPDAAPAQRSLFTLVPSLEFAERCYDIAKLGEIPEQLWRGRYSDRSIWSAFMGLPREIFSTATSRSSSFSSCALYQVGRNTAVPLPGCICVVRAHIPEGA